MRNDMTRATRLMLIAGAAVTAIGLASVAQSQNAMTFFITSAGPGKGAAPLAIAGLPAHNSRPWRLRRIAGRVEELDRPGGRFSRRLDEDPVAFRLQRADHTRDRAAVIDAQAREPPPREREVLQVEAREAMAPRNGIDPC